FINPYYGDEIAMDAAVSNEKRVSVYSVAAQGIVGYVERGMGNSSELSEYLKGVLFPYRGLRFSAVVAGCTHFPFARDSIISALGYAPEFFDGGIGAANRMKKLLGDKKMLRNEGGGIGWTLWLSSDARGSYPEYSGLLRDLMRVEK
ncbi:MAG: hypothetical protein IKB34_00445, partial [Clostridia bacterium]|nr:hypothetical protein [Clostridia bacterium]